MSKKLKSKGLKGYSPMSLRNCRAFYRTYPQIQQSVIVELQNSGVDIHKFLPFGKIQIYLEHIPNVRPFNALAGTENCFQ